MKTCTYIEITSKGYQDCDNLCEGNTEFCASHNRKIRKEQKEALNAIVKRQALLSKPKKVYAKPNKVSEKRKVLNAEYSILREEFLKTHTECEMKLQVCTKVATQVHHTASGWNKATNLNNVKTWRASCDNCNQFLHDRISAKEARDKGLKI